MIEKVINRRNLQLACKQVMSNKGSAGVDGTPVQELSAYLEINREHISSALLNGKYLPQATMTTPMLGAEHVREDGQ